MDVLKKTMPEVQPSFAGPCSIGQARGGMEPHLELFDEHIYLPTGTQEDSLDVGSKSRSSFCYQHYHVCQSY